MRDLVDRIEHNRFAGREFLLWLWFESQIFETNLAPTGATRCAMWIETRLALGFEKEDSVLKSAAPADGPEAKEALRQGKLPREARLRMTTGEHEFAWVLRADTLSLGSVTIPAELESKKDDVHEVLYERMRLVEELEAILEALWGDFLTLRLSGAWNEGVLPALRRFAHAKPVDAKSYLELKKKVLAKRPRKAA